MYLRKMAVAGICLLLAVTSFAQGGPGNFWKRISKAVTQMTGKENRRAEAALEKTVRSGAEKAHFPGWTKVLELRTLWGAKKAHQKRFEQNIRYGVFQVLDETLQPIGTGFVFVRPNGSGQIWAAAAAHLTKQVGEKISVKLYIGGESYISAVFTVKARGSVGFHNPDMVLLEVPDWVKKYTKPLEVDTRPVRKGDMVDSYGFHGPQIGKQLIKTAGRKILDVQYWRIMTTYNYGTKDGYAQGACGSPVIRDGKVVGLHVGSYFGRYSYVLDFARASKLLFEEMEKSGAGFSRDVRVNGQTVLKLTLAQRVSDVAIFRGGKKVDDICITRHFEPVDYLHLEKTLHILPGDELRFRITTEGQEERTYITYTVK